MVENRTTLDAMVIRLLEVETLNKEEIAQIFKKVNSWPRRPAWTGSATRTPSQQPPVDVPERIATEPVVEKKPARVRKTSKKDDDQ